MTRKEIEEALNFPMFCGRSDKGEYYIVYKDAMEGLEQAVAQLLKETRWVPITERLPDWNGEVMVVRKTRSRPEIVCFNNEPSNSRYGYEILRGFWDKVCINEEVSHWRPMPEPPEESK